jgi:hypothetical protein
MSSTYEDISLELNVLNDKQNKRLSKYDKEELRRKNYAYSWICIYTFVYVPLIITNLYMGFSSNNNILNTTAQDILLTLGDYLIFTGIFQIPIFGCIIYDSYWVNMALYEGIGASVVLMIERIILLCLRIIMILFSIITFVVLLKLEKRYGNNANGILAYVIIVLLIQMFMTLVDILYLFGVINAPHQVKEDKDFTKRPIYDDNSDII